MSVKRHLGAVGRQLVIRDFERNGKQYLGVGNSASLDTQSIAKPRKQGPCGKEYQGRPGSGGVRL